MTIDTAVPNIRRSRHNRHFLRDCLGHARRDHHGLLAALIRPIFAAESSAP